MLLKVSSQLIFRGTKVTPRCTPFATSRAFLSTRPQKITTSENNTRSPSNLVTHEEGVHQTMKLSKTYRNKPLCRRQGDVRFKTGLEAAKILVKEAKRRDPHESVFLDSVTSTMESLAPVFDRNPTYAFVAKQLMEPERYIQFRVAYIDDTGVMRLNRGYRIQYSSALGPYEGQLHFGSHVNSNSMKSLGFDTIFSNSITGYDIGAAVGGADIDITNKSDAEIQRFCQSYMTELSKYIGPDIDQPGMGMGVGEKEIGFLYGQYKRINIKSSSGGKPFLTTGNPTFVQATGYGVAHLARRMLEDKNDTLVGKRCLVIGSGKVARSLAERLVAYGAIPITFSDEKSGFVYEPKGFDDAKLRIINAIKNDRGASIGRYIMSSTSAKFNEGSVYDIPCDLCFPCGEIGDIGAEEVTKLADNGCKLVLEGCNSSVTLEGRKFLKKRGISYGPHTLTMTGAHIVTALGWDATDDMLAGEMDRIYDEVKTQAREFNNRGDLFMGANIAGFIRVANAMMSHGAI